KKAAERNHVEGKFGQAKRGYGLNNIKARLASTSASWIQAIIFVMNLTKLLHVAEKYHGIFVPILKWLRKLQKLIQKLIWQPERSSLIGFHLNLAG
ncbi:MAG: transposase, partial [Bacteroidales bacterium]|nr:transposase [Bacteroidales bacterium]